MPRNAQIQMKIKKRSTVGFCERLPLPPNYTQRFADSAACWSVDQVALSLWLRHCQNDIALHIATCISDVITKAVKKLVSYVLTFSRQLSTGSCPCLLYCTARPILFNPLYGSAMLASYPVVLS